LLVGRKSTTTTTDFGPGRSSGYASASSEVTCITSAATSTDMSRDAWPDRADAVRPSHGRVRVTTGERGNSRFQFAQVKVRQRHRMHSSKQPALLRLASRHRCRWTQDRRRQVEKIRAWISDRIASWNSPYRQTQLAAHAQDSRRTDLVTCSELNNRTRPPWDNSRSTRWRPRVQRCKVVGFVTTQYAPDVPFAGNQGISLFPPR